MKKEDQLGMFILPRKNISRRSSYVRAYNQNRTGSSIRPPEPGAGGAVLPVCSPLLTRVGSASGSAAGADPAGPAASDGAAPPPQPGSLAERAGRLLAGGGTRPSRDQTHQQPAP